MQAADVSSPSVQTDDWKKDILKLVQDKIFLGKYTERRYVESLNLYRDVIIIDSDEDICENLFQVKRILEKNCKTTKWIGITKNTPNVDSSSYLLWVKLKNVTIAKHWFQIKNVIFDEEEIIMEVQHVQVFKSPNKSFCIDRDSPEFDFKEIFTYQNIKEAIKFTLIVIMTIFTLFIEILKYLGDYSIKFSNILVHLVHVSTPICLGAMEFLSRCVGGLYWLIFVLIRGSPNTPAVPRALMSNRKSIAYRPSIGTPGVDNHSFRSDYDDDSYSSSRQNFSLNINKSYQRH